MPALELHHDPGNRHRQEQRIEREVAYTRGDLPAAAERVGSGGGGGLTIRQTSRATSNAITHSPSVMWINSTARSRRLREIVAELAERPAGDHATGVSQCSACGKAP